MLNYQMVFFGPPDVFHALIKEIAGLVGCLPYPMDGGSIHGVSKKKTMGLEWKIPHFRKPPYPLVNYQFAMKWPNMTVDLPTKDGDFP